MSENNKPSKTDIFIMCLFKQMKTGILEYSHMHESLW